MDTEDKIAAGQLVLLPFIYIYNLFILVMDEGTQARNPPWMGLQSIENNIHLFIPRGKKYIPI